MESHRNSIRRSLCCYGLNRLPCGDHLCDSQLMAGHAEEVAPFRFLTGGSFMQVLDGAGYFFMGLATLFAAPVFSGTRLENLTRWAFIANGVLSVPILLSYSPLVIPASIYPVFLGLGALWIFTTPLSTFLAALCFQRSISSSTMNREPKRKY